MVPLLAAEVSWASVLGNFLMNYGVLDSQVLFFLQSRANAADFAKLKDCQFHYRVQVAAMLASQAAEHREEFKKVFSRIEPMRVLRNHIAHGMLRIGPGQEQDGNSCEVTLTVPKDLNGAGPSAGRQLTFTELQEGLKELNSLIEDLRRLCGG